MADTWLWRRIDALARSPRWVVLGLSMVLAASVGYLLERAILAGWSTLLVAPDGVLAAVGVVAALFAALLWGAAHASGARRGAFIHAVADSRLPRHVSEDALLRATVTGTWPRAVVMPFRVVPLQDHAWQDAAKGQADTIREQVNSASVANPGARAVSILPGGPAHVLALAGALTDCTLSDVDGEVRLIADDTSEVANPFIEFPLDRPAPAPGAQSPAGGAVGVLLLLRSGAHDQLLTPIRDRLRARHGQVTIRVVSFEHPIKESGTAYSELLGRVRSEVDRLRGEGVGQVYLQSQGPAALTFAAGFTASRGGLAVASMPFHWGSGEDDPGEYHFPADGDGDPWAVHRRAQEGADARGTSHDQDPGAVGAQRQLGRRWYGVLISYSLAMGVFLPVFAGSVALLLEWALARSQTGAAQVGDWWQLILILLVSGLLVMLGAWHLAPRLDRPAVLITANPGRPTLSRRVALIDGTALDKSAAGVAQAVTRQFCDIIAALPGAEQVEVDLGSRLQCQHGHEAVCDPEHSLRKALRGTRPVVLRWNGLEAITGPGPCPETWQAAGASPDAEAHRGR